MNIADGDRDRLCVIRTIDDLMNHLSLMFWLVNDVDAFFLLFVFGNHVVLQGHFTVVCRQQMFLEKRFVAEAFFAVTALRHFQVDLVVSAERRFMSERHKACYTLMWFRSAVYEHMLLKGRSVGEFFSAKFC